MIILIGEVLPLVLHRVSLHGLLVVHGPAFVAIIRFGRRIARCICRHIDRVLLLGTATLLNPLFAVLLPVVPFPVLRLL